MAKNTPGTPYSNTGVPTSRKKGSKTFVEPVLDWVCVSLKKHTIIDIKKYFGNDFVKVDYAPMFYDYMLVYHEKIKVLVSSRKDMNLCILLSGRGCRELENYYSWDTFFRFIKLYGHHTKTGEYISNFNFTRIDYSYDFYNWNVDILDKVKSHFDKGNYTSLFRRITSMYAKDGKGYIIGRSFRFGKRDSDLSVIIYDKLLERNANDHIVDKSIKSWTRIECNFMGANAMLLFDMIDKQQMNVSKEVMQILYKYIDFKRGGSYEDKKHNNMCRRLTAKWWRDTLNVTEKLSFSKKAYQSTIDKKINVVEHKYMKSLSMAVVSVQLTRSKRKKVPLLNELITKSVKKLNDMDLQVVNEHLLKNGLKPITMAKLKQLIKNLV